MSEENDDQPLESSDEDDPLLSQETQEFPDEDEIPPLSTEGDALEEMDGAFEEMETGNVDPDDVWTEVAEDGTDEASVDAEESGDEDGEEIVAADIAEVSKHDYCERCEFFSEPPDIHCTHEGTEILDFTDMEMVRLANCPIVAERRSFEQGIVAGIENPDGGT